MARQLNVISLSRPDDSYVFLFDNESLPQLIEVLQQFADDDDLEFSLQDAQMIGHQAKESIRIQNEFRRQK